MRQTPRKSLERNETGILRSSAPASNDSARAKAHCDQSSIIAEANLINFHRANCSLLFLLLFFLALSMDLNLVDSRLKIILLVLLITVVCSIKSGETTVTEGKFIDWIVAYFYIASTCVLYSTITPVNAAESLSHSINIMRLADNYEQKLFHGSDWCELYYIYRSSRKS